MDYTNFTSDPLGEFLIVIAAIFMFFFIVLLILLPFYVQSINTWTRTSAKELKKIREILVKMRRQEHKNISSEDLESIKNEITRK